MNTLLERLKSVVRRGADATPDLEVRIACFREILHANNTALGLIARIQEALAGERAVSGADVRRLVAGVTVQTYRMISNLNRMTGNRFRAVSKRFEELRGTLAARVEVTPYLREVGPVVPLAEVGAEMAEVVGQKSAFLGEARRILGGHVPEGFATTAAAYREFMTAGDLDRRVAEALEGLEGGDVAACFRASAQATQAIEGAPLPASLAEALDRAVAAATSGGAVRRFAVRSSALQEGGLEMSFAGQYRSLLNVTPAAVGEAFRQVVASKYSPQAITYRLGLGFADDEVAMCCCAIGMVDALAAGVLYSACSGPQGPVTLLQAVRGLGLSAVDGSAEPDSYLLDRCFHRVVERRLGMQASLLRCAPDEGTEKLSVPDAFGGTPILTDEQAERIASLAWRLEDALGMPIDMEWALDGADNAYVLQVRPQPEHAEEAQRPAKERVAGAQVVLDVGSRASGGAGCGPARLVETDLDILRFPAGAVLVTGEASPRLAVLLPRAAALVADMGEVTGHLATVARELRVPALLATRTATSTLADGVEITVDADAGVVYAGRVEEALAAGGEQVPTRRNPHVERLASAAELIVPLTLRDRMASGHSPRRCRTLHDIIRFCHQATVEAMFSLGDRAMRLGATARKLVSEVPIDCRVFDLGGGLREGLGPGDVTIDDVTCAPMRALWAGIADPRLKWRMTRPVSLSGFMSALVNYNFDQDSRVRSMGEPSYAFITADYLSLNSRVGYHFSTVDARISDEVESSYASFRFVGGSTGVDQRSRRAILIMRLLAAHGFETDVKADLVNARLRHRPRAEMERALALMGLVTGFVNHLDMALTSDAAVKVYEDAFMAGRYGYKGGEEDG